MTASFDDGKEDGALRTIGEVSKALDIKTHVLRYWEQQFPQLEPLKRSGGRRYYRSEDVALIETIDRLVNQEGYTIKGAQKALAAHEVEVGEMPEPSEPKSSEPTDAASSEVPFPFRAPETDDGGVASYFGSPGANDAEDDAISAESADANEESSGTAEPNSAADAGVAEVSQDQDALVQAINAEVVARLKTMRGKLSEALIA